MSQTRLFIGNLPENTNESDLQNAFSTYGKILNLDMKSKSTDEANKSKFAFITLNTSNCNIESCIRDFSQEKFFGKSLYVTRARESFLERLQRERLEGEKKLAEIVTTARNQKPIIKLGEKLNPRKRKVDFRESDNSKNDKITNNCKPDLEPQAAEECPGDGKNVKTQDADKKRIESLKKKRQEFKEKQKIIKTGLMEIDKVQNKKIRFDYHEEDTDKKNHKTSPSKKSTDNKRKKSLFEEDDSGDEVNFDIKKQFEGKHGQKILDLQSKYKSDKRFVLDERFIEEEQADEDGKQSIATEDTIELGQKDEKTKQLNILQDVLGVTIRSSNDPDNTKIVKPKMGMLRFDPTQPEHAKYLAQQEKVEPFKKSKKKKSKEKQNDEIEQEAPQKQVSAVEVSKEQFYKVTETLKEAIAQPTTFSLRSLFNKNVDEDSKQDETTGQDENYIPLGAPKAPRVKNPFDQKEKNPFVYDSSDSETEDKEEPKKDTQDKTETKAVWRENLFFTEADHRLKDGLAFFNKPKENEVNKDRRELKSLMKKRISNKESKNHMFQKKIGGKRKSMKRSFRKKK